VHSIYKSILDKQLVGDQTTMKIHPNRLPRLSRRLIENRNNKGKNNARKKIWPRENKNIAGWIQLKDGKLTTALHYCGQSDSRALIVFFYFTALYLFKNRNNSL